jgi:hypothetical protein
METDTAPIRRKEDLQELLAKYKREEMEYSINIPGMQTTELMKTFENHGLNYTRCGFKKWKLSSPQHKKARNGGNEMVALRLLFLISAILLLFLLVFYGLSIIWEDVEYYLVSLPIAGSVVSAAIFAGITGLFRILMKKRVQELFADYLGVERKSEPKPKK